MVDDLAPINSANIFLLKVKILRVTRSRCKIEAKNIDLNFIKPDAKDNIKTNKVSMNKDSKVAYYKVIDCRVTSNRDHKGNNTNNIDSKDVLS